MSSSSSRPLPHLPLETQATILRFCDPSTLAVSSRVSLAWLELAGPILYEHITIRGKEQLEMMIRSETVLPSIALWVSLDQTRTFTCAPTCPDDLRDMDVSSELCSDPGRIEELVVDLRETGLAEGQDGAVNISLDALLTSFNPQHLHVLAQPVSYARIICYLFLLSRQLVWSQLRKVRFTHSLSSNGSGDFPSLVGRSPPLDLEYEVSTQAAEYDDFEETLVEILADLVGHSNQVVDHHVFGHVQVVNNKDEVALAKERLVGCSCTSLEIGVKTH